MDILRSGEVLVDSVVPERLPNRNRVNSRELVAHQTTIHTPCIGVRDGRNQRLGQCAETVGRDFVAWERLSRQRVVNGNQVAGGINEVGEITLLHGRRGYGSDTVQRLVLPEPIGADVEEGTIAAVIHMRDPDRAADGEAVVVLLIDGRLRFPGWRKACGKEPRRVKKLVAQDIENISMQTVRPRGQAERDRALAETVLRIEGGCIYTELIDS